MKEAKTSKFMTKAKLITEVSERTHLFEADVERALDGVIQTIQRELQKGNDLRVTGLGTFSVVQLKERQGRNPRTGKAMKLPAVKLPKFRAGTKLKASIE